MARWPAPGRCKLRLADSLGFVTAAKVQKRLTAHTLSVVSKVRQRSSIKLHLAVNGLGPLAAARWGASSGADQTWLQGCGNLGMCMRRVLLKLQRGAKLDPRVILIGTDLPSLVEADLEEAIRALHHGSIVLGPSADGGYWLLGLGGNLLRPLAIWPFASIPWGTDAVLEAMLRRACQVGLKPVLLSGRQDLDRVTDLASWLR